MNIILIINKYKELSFFSLYLFKMDHCNFHNKKLAILVVYSTLYFERNNYEYSNFGRKLTLAGA